MTDLPRYLDVHHDHDRGGIFTVVGFGRTPADALAPLRRAIEAGPMRLPDHAVYLNASVLPDRAELQQLLLTCPFVAALWNYATREAIDAQHAPPP